MKKIESKKEILKKLEAILKNVPESKKGTAVKSIREDRDKG